MLVSVSAGYVLTEPSDLVHFTVQLVAFVELSQVMETVLWFISNTVLILYGLIIFVVVMEAVAVSKGEPGCARS